MNKYKVTSIIVVLIIILSIIIYFLINNIKIDEIGIENKSDIIETKIISTYDSPKVPDGFKRIETSDASWELDENEKPKGWNSGLVIEDENGNQFIWVPCTIDGTNNTVKYSRYTLDYDSLVNQNEGVLVTNTLSELSETPYSQWYFYETDNVNDEISKSIKKYQGFYIGRYETGIENGTLNSKEITQKFNSYTGWENGNAVVKPNVYAWNYITKDKALEISNDFINNDSIKSSLITSYCWDTTIKWISNSIPDFATNSQNYGSLYNVKYPEEYNHSEKAQYIIENYISATTGTSNDKYKNIHDIAGNLKEFTTEIAKNTAYNKNPETSQKYCALRGEEVSIGQLPTFYSCNARTSFYSNVPTPFFGFRMVLYIK